LGGKPNAKALMSGAACATITDQVVEQAATGGSAARMPGKDPGP